ncbi:hypothetical protein ME763_32075 [Streptomyces murinus]|uniref:hypothetical protein n=1 Tax=Streptomyces murinus TaxID=33900 RepID=UPI000A1EBB7D|nr:hypothetical protein [Streptomyces murinus]WDO09928.1 hypothetical protein ME763_32075 [Streptomyces murinus]
MTTYDIPRTPIQDRPDGFEEQAVQDAVLRDTLTAAGLDLGAYERQIIEWLSHWEWATVAVICSWVARAAATRPPASPVALPSRFDATPAEVDQHLRRILAEDVYLRYQQTIGGLAVEEAAKDVRMTVRPEMSGIDQSARYAAADEIDPLKGGGLYPSKLQCSQHGGFGPCPGAPRCTPQESS